VAGVAAELDEEEDEEEEEEDEEAAELGEDDEEEYAEESAEYEDEDEDEEEEEAEHSAGELDEAEAEAEEEASEPEVVLEPQPAPEGALAPEHLLRECGALFIKEGRVAVSLLQRRFALDFDEACEVLDELQEQGLIGPYMGGQRRDILLTLEEWQARVPSS
jgi:DNA segregation ATPase FtsK/SpoIIIE-like protein